ncbi:enoyl-CoA hydratase/isomerase family protein [Pseudonocardia sp. KRD-184]|uniref:Enoyl-CoA hydratase/isomerase family protein n=2 Tax=Pseudonocardia TaxID=1847 RepID=A0A6M6JX39_9PSEU|nr:enoyl-CoA hydratase/isomerase family protein [Pseudonocardia oceani]QJY51092.1 enoyl-CoA hydratase/isomerase family protein [Pseudonocardia broussonetiae]MBW0096275.1 enoyl-CoA hydratase/isomerase family protein [Pseudonocardia oceani]MBW0107636.1 enoyl-CoA hydratase/isomerase family protein [Pseudonocardia oceani]MBW0123120.1 enoyl-CoA hydratase/isomerase family protein [Pseudonocardia oceani]
MLCEVSAGVAVVTLAAPQRRNALTVEMATELEAVFDEIDARQDVGAVVLRGSGGSFCAGADLGVLSGAAQDPLDDDAQRHIDALYGSFLRVGRCRAASIAAVRGPAVGAGLNLVLATDLRIVARDARLISGFGRIGVHPGGGHFTLLSRAAGRDAAAGVGLFGQEIDGERAAALGLAWQAVDDTDVEATALRTAARLGADPALSRRMTASFRREAGPPATSWDVGLEVERGPQMWSFRRRASTPTT